jgi:hypothetical protein
MNNQNQQNVRMNRFIPFVPFIPFIPSEPSFSRYQSPCRLLEKSPRQICNVAEKFVSTVFISGNGTGVILFRESQQAIDPKRDIGFCAGNSGDGDRF